MSIKNKKTQLINFDAIMAIEAIRWYGIQEQAEEALFVSCGFQIPTETKDFNDIGIDIEFLLFEEFRTICDDKSNGFSDRCKNSSLYSFIKKRIT
jgi:hypothetical protein